MKFIAALIAGLALTGCDVTFGADGPVVTPSDSFVGQLVPFGNRAAPPDAQTSPNTDQATPASNAAATPDRPRRTLSDITVRAMRPSGITGDQVNQFKAAVAASGCTISTISQRATIQSQTGLDVEQQDSIRDYLWRAGELDRSSGSYMLTSGPCADA